MSSIKGKEEFQMDNLIITRVAFLNKKNAMIIEQGHSDLMNGLIKNNDMVNLMTDTLIVRMQEKQEDGSMKEVPRNQWTDKLDVMEYSKYEQIIDNLKSLIESSTAGSKKK